MPWFPWLTGAPEHEMHNTRPALAQRGKSPGQSYAELAQPPSPSCGGSHTAHQHRTSCDFCQDAVPLHEQALHASPSHTPTTSPHTRLPPTPPSSPDSSLATPPPSTTPSSPATLATLATLDPPPLSDLPMGPSLASPVRQKTAEIDRLRAQIEILDAATAPELPESSEEARALRLRPKLRIWARRTSAADSRWLWRMFERERWL